MTRFPLQSPRKTICSLRVAFLFAALIRAFGPALVTHFARLGFCFARLVVFPGPIAAIGAEMPGVFVQSASIGCWHSVPAHSKSSGLTSELGPTQEREKGRSECGWRCGRPLQTK